MTLGAQVHGWARHWVPASDTTYTDHPSDTESLEERLGLKPALHGELETRFLAALPQIDDAVRLVSRRNRLSASERDDFASEVRLAFIEHDYKVLARFEGRSSLRTYLITVVNRLFLDHRRRLWGKWHASAQATRLGPIAERLELLVHRDGHSVGEACQILGSEGVAETSAQLVELAARLPPRQRVRVTSLSDAEPDSNRPGPSPDDPHEAFEGNETASRCQTAISLALERLPAEDRVVLRLRFEDGISVADIARGLKLDQKKLYRRLEDLLEQLRQALEAAGLGWDDVHRMIERGQCHLRLPPAFLAPTAEKPPSRPSTVQAMS